MFEEYLAVALKAAHSAGAIQLEGLSRQQRIETKSSPIDLVTEVDRTCEAEIARQILERFPDHQLLAEEGTIGGANPLFRWVIDPLDGTTNYTHRYPCFSVSIGLEYEGQIVVGVVYDALHQELFRATANGGAYLNDQPIKVSDVPKLGQGLLCTGFPGDQAGNQQVLVAWEKISLKCQGIRRDGSAALDLCYVASGRFDGFWERLNSWDMAAGSLIVREAGGTVTNFRGEPFDLYQREIVASNGRIGPEMVEVLANPLT
jgi:myo-inositol-1(or 4)-monophosphatase